MVEGDAGGVGGEEEVVEEAAVVEETLPSFMVHR